MANTQPRRLMKKRDPLKRRRIDDEPWTQGDPDKRIGLNTPIHEPLMLKLDFLIANKVIFSKAQFIRDVVEKAADEEIKRARRLHEAERRIAAEERGK